MALSTSKSLSRRIAELDRKRGLLIAFEGPDGSGKTTQRKLLQTWLESQRRRVVATRWASSPLVKPLLKPRTRLRTLSAEEQSLLHAVDFRCRVESTILPALAAGQIVLADRYLFTALARAAARGLEFDWLLHVYAPLLWPDLVLYLAMNPAESNRRVASLGAPQFDETGQDLTGLGDPLASYEHFVRRVVVEYENLAVIFHFVRVDAAEPVYRLHQRVRGLVTRAGKRPWPTFSAEAVAEWLARH